MYCYHMAVVTECRTGNTRGRHQVSPVAGPGNNMARDVDIETVHARQGDALNRVSNTSAAQGNLLIAFLF